MGSVPPAALGVGSGVLSMMRTLGVVTGVAVLGAVYAAHQPPAPDGGTAPFSVAAFGAAFRFAAAVAMAAAAVSVVGARRRVRRAPALAPRPRQIGADAHPTGQQRPASPGERGEVEAP